MDFNIENKEVIIRRNKIILCLPLKLRFLKRKKINYTNFLCFI